MKTTKYLSLAALALMGTLASCQSDDDFTIARPDNAVGINVTVGSLQATRSNPAATDDTQREFNQGDQVCVSTDGQDPVIFQCQNADQQTWAEAVSGKFLLWTQNEMNFKAYYPVTEGTSMTAFTLPADQSTEAKIALADYMTREQTRNNGSGTDITLDLERKTARVIVNIAGFTDQYDDDEKTVSNVRIYSEASGIEDGSPTGSSTEIQPYAQGNGGQGSTYTALVVPGDGESGADFITLTDGEGSSLRVKDIHELNAGNSYTFNLVVGKNRIEVASVTVQDWTTGETLAGGQAQEQGSASVPVTSITLNKTETSIEVGSTETLSVTAVAPDNATDKTYTWKTSDESKATVDQDGKVTAVAEGTVTIYAEANDGSGVKGNCTVTVTAITLNNTTTAWTAGTYVVPAGGLTYSDAITVSGDVTLTLTDGETLTLNKGISLAEGATLTIQGNGTMNINGTDGNTSSTAGGNHGTLVLTSGTLTARGGNGGSVDGYQYEARGGNGGDAINGSVIVSGGTLTATGGNGGSVGEASDESHGGNGGDAISGSVIVSGGTLTARGGNGGSVGGGSDESSGGNGGDAINGTLTKNGGSTSVNDGSNGSISGEDATAGTGGKGHN